MLNVFYLAVITLVKSSLQSDHYFSNLKTKYAILFYFMQRSEEDCTETIEAILETERS